MVDLLSEQERNEITQIPENTTKEEIVKYYTLSEADLVIANKYRTAPNRLGFAIQLCVLRHTGLQFNYIKNVPYTIISFVAE